MVVGVNEKASWVAFNHVPGIGVVRLRALLGFYGSLEVAWSAPMDGLRSAGIPEKVVEQVIRVRRELDPLQLWEKVARRGITVLTWNDPAYPRRLQEIDQPPPVLYLRGELTPEDEWAVAIVGTRRITGYSRQVAEELAGYLARNGVTVVSGLAQRIDGVAHDAELKAGGRTLAVLGCGVDIIHPPEARKLAEGILADGALISDHAPGTPPESVNFPPRNRNLSGLCPATGIVEAGETSAALITARFAADQGREVFTVPGGIHAPQSAGANRLISDGVRPLLRMEDLLQTLHLEQVQEHLAARHTQPLDETESKVYGSLASEPVHIEHNCHHSGLPIERVSATLTIMKIKGLIRQVGSMNYGTMKESTPLDRVTRDE